MSQETILSPREVDARCIKDCQEVCRSHEALRADRDRLREERDKAEDRQLERGAELAKLREEIAAKDAEIAELKIERDSLSSSLGSPR
jgi:SMC interacting uncharacterized protein involved in chromosome segregation